MKFRIKPDALWPAYTIIERETSMTEQKRRFEDQLPSERLDWEHGGEPSGDPIRVERQQALLNCAAAMLKAEGSASVAVAFPDTDPAQYVMIGTADEILGLLPVPGATDGLLRAKIRDIVALVIERKDIDDLLDDPDLVRLVSAITAMAVRVAGATPSAAPAAGQAGLAKPSVLDLPSAIMNLPCHYKGDLNFEIAYKEGHRDARHDAADLVLARADELALLATPVAADTEQATDEQQKECAPPFAAPAGQHDARDPNWLLGTMDGKDWADEFCRLNSAADHSMMLGWFCNAIMVGYDTGRRHEADEQSSTAGAAKGGTDINNGAPLATPADAGAGQNEDLRTAIAEAVARGWCAPQNANKEMDYHLARAIVSEVEREVLARMSTPGAPVMATTREAFEAWMRAEGWENYLERYNVYDPKDERSYKNRHTADKWEGWEACAKFLGQSPAPVTAEPVASIDTPEFRAKLDAWAQTDCDNAAATADLISYIDRHIVTHSAPADRDAIRDQVLEEAAHHAECIGTDWLEADDAHKSYAADYISKSIRALKSMERAADAKGDA